MRSDSADLLGKSFYLSELCLDFLITRYKFNTNATKILKHINPNTVKISPLRTNDIRRAANINPRIDVNIIVAIFVVVFFIVFFVLPNYKHHRAHGPIGEV